MTDDDDDRRQPAKQYWPIRRAGIKQVCLENGQHHFGMHPKVFTQFLRNYNRYRHSVTNTSLFIGVDSNWRTSFAVALWYYASSINIDCRRSQGPVQASDETLGKPHVRVVRRTSSRGLQLHCLHRTTVRVSALYCLFSVLFLAVYCL